MLTTYWKRLLKAVNGRLRPSDSEPSVFMRVAYHVPRQVVLITTEHEGEANVWPIDWHVPLSEEPRLYGIAVNTSGYGTALVRTSGVFIVNFVPASWEEKIFTCGRLSGRDVDKFAEAGLSVEPAETVPAPRLSGALGYLECRVDETVAAGDHTFFVGTVDLARECGQAPRLHHLHRRQAAHADTFEARSA